MKIQMSLQILPINWKCIPFAILQLPTGNSPFLASHHVTESRAYRRLPQALVKFSGCLRLLVAVNLGIPMEIIITINYTQKIQLSMSCFKGNTDNLENQYFFWQDTRHTSLLFERRNRANRYTFKDKNNES